MYVMGFVVLDSKYIGEILVGSWEIWLGIGFDREFCDEIFGFNLGSFGQDLLNFDLILI